MIKKLLLLSLVLVFAGALGVLALSAQGRTVPINASLTGEFITIGDGPGLFDVDLKGSPGTAKGRGLSFSNPVPHGDLPPGNTCDDLPSEFDGLVITDGAFNMRFSDGSLLFGKAASGGYVCFYPPKAFAPYDLVGGTGRYEGATGYVQYDIVTHNIGGSTAVVAETGSATGEIILP